MITPLTRLSLTMKEHPFVKLVDCPNSIQLANALDAAFVEISERELTDIVHILDCALPFRAPVEDGETACLKARNLILNAALAPRPFKPSRLWPTDPAA